MTVTVTSFLADPRYSSYSTLYSNDYIEVVIEDAASDLPVELWGDLHDRGVMLLTCHRLTMANNSQNGLAIGGGISSLSASQGSQSVSFSGGSSDAKADPENLAATECGRQLLLLKKKTKPVTGVTVNTGRLYEYGEFG